MVGALIAISGSDPMCGRPNGDGTGCSYGQPLLSYRGDGSLWDISELRESDEFGDGWQSGTAIRTYEPNLAARGIEGAVVASCTGDGFNRAMEQ